MVKKKEKEKRIQCPICSQENPINHNFCLACGEPIRKEIREIVHRNRRKAWCWAAIFLVLAVVWAAIAYAVHVRWLWLFTGYFAGVAVIQMVLLTVGLKQTRKLQLKFARRFVPRVATLEQRLLNYIKKHGVVVDKEKCLEDLGITEDELREALKMLKEAGKLQI